jgi:hypothetical protein
VSRANLSLFAHVNKPNSNTTGFMASASDEFGDSGRATVAKLFFEQVVMLARAQGWAARSIPAWTGRRPADLESFVPKDRRFHWAK